MCINEGLHSPINKNKQMNQRTHVWSADEVRTTVPAQLVCAVTEIDLVLKNVITVQGCFHYTEVPLMISRIQFCI